MHTTPRITVGFAVVCLLLNMFIWPGLGSLLGGRMRGVVQGSLIWVGLILGFVRGPGTFTIVPLIIGAAIGWLWAIGTGISLISEGATATAEAAVARALATRPPASPPP